MEETLSEEKDEQEHVKLHVVLCDDHTLIRHAARSILESSGKYEIVGDAEDADQAIALVKELDPDILIIDIGLPEKSGIEVIHEIREHMILPKVAVLSMFQEEDRIKQAILAGASAYLFKDFSPELLLNALERAKRGQFVLPKDFEHLRPEIQKLLDEGARDIPKIDPLEVLSKREKEIFLLIADGLPNRVIAKKLFISPRTVETHRARIIKKLDFNSTADLIRYAIKHNLLAP